MYWLVRSLERRERANIVVNVFKSYKSWQNEKTERKNFSDFFVFLVMFQNFFMSFCWGRFERWWRTTKDESLIIFLDSLDKRDVMVDSTEKISQLLFSVSFSGGNWRVRVKRGSKVLVEAVENLANHRQNLINSLSTPMLSKAIQEHCGN